MEHVLDIQVERIYLMQQTETSLKAFADVCLNGSIVIKGIKIIDGRNGLFVSMPQEKSKDDKWYDNIRCVNKTVREQLSDAVLSAYEQKISVGSG